MEYGLSRICAFQRLAELTEKVVRGSHVADIPVETPRTLELVLNVTAALQAGLSFPPTFFTLADEVIEQSDDRR